MDQGAQKTDVRKDFILTTSENYFGISLPKENFSKLNIDSFLDNFLDDPSCFTLSVSCVDTEHGRKLLLDTKISLSIIATDESNKGSLGWQRPGDAPGGDSVMVFFKVTPGGDSVLVFFKVKAEVVTPENLHSNVFVSSMVESPVCTLYHAIKTIYAPVLLQ
ncbi:unnamed protein product, partial [Timema podura]|nr:unnamed protein product [Timema podura]